MKKMKYIFTFLFAACFLVSCDDLSMNETIASAPIIENFAPAQGSVGSKIVVAGKALNGVTTALLGEKECEIVEKLSNTCLTIEVPNEARTGKITLVNVEGEGVSENEFAVEYPAPMATAASVQTDVEMGNKMLISGKNMNVITAVYLTADGGNVKHEASVISKNANEIVFTVPYVEKDDAHVTFTYFDGTATQETSADLLPMLHVKRYQPVVTTTEFGDNSVGDEITLSGSYLNKINKVFVGDVECMVSLQTENTLKFVVPNSDNFVDGHNETSLSITYFDGIETRVLTEHFGVNGHSFTSGRTRWFTDRDVMWSLWLLSSHLRQDWFMPTVCGEQLSTPSLISIKPIPVRVRISPRLRRMSTIRLILTSSSRA